jgi:diamine N-acetyltransferase
MIQADNILLRALEPEDIDLLYEWENDMSLWEVSNTLTPFSKHQLQEYIKNAKLDLYQTKQLRLIICGRINQLWQTVGLLDLFDFDPYHNRGGLGITIHRQYRQQKWAQKALQVFITYSFDYLGMQQLYANIGINNQASITLFESLGFVLSGRKKKWRKTASGYMDELFYQKFK